MIMTRNITETMQYLCTISIQVKHEVAGVGYVRGHNSSVLAVNIKVQTSVSVHYQSNV